MSPAYTFQTGYAGDMPALRSRREHIPAETMKASGNNLSAITRELWAQWQHTKASWKDARSEEFERKYLEELLASVDRTVTVIEQLDKVLMKVRKDCE